MSKSSKKSGPNKSTGTPATVALDRAKVPHTLHSYEHDPRAHHFGEEAAVALGIDPERIFKTLVVELTSADVPLVTAVVPASGQLSLKAIASATHAKRAELAPPAVAQRTTGFIVGGISPIGQKHQTPVYLDASAREQQTIFVSAGRRGLSVEITAQDLAELTGAQFAELGC
ncbi:Cys-tRNA(Pro) deacylase [Propionibacterium sp.]|uniref:Cys-tRNA(Pro) deacylase n=1 Tax=Propionibacterium sp. TaxID=1977903 RepID=UPI0039E7F035